MNDPLGGQHLTTHPQRQIAASPTHPPRPSKLRLWMLDSPEGRRVTSAGYDKDADSTATTRDPIDLKVLEATPGHSAS